MKGSVAFCNRLMIGACFIVVKINNALMAITIYDNDGFVLSVHVLKFSTTTKGHTSGSHEISSERFCKQIMKPNLKIGQNK